MAAGDRTRNSSLKLQQGKNRLDIRKIFLSIRVVKPYRYNDLDRLWDLHLWKYRISEEIRQTLAGDG